MPTIRGYAARFEPLPLPKVARERALMRARLARDADSQGDGEAERMCRNALENLVDAFLLDRRGNRDCFARAHNLGLRVQRHYGCSVAYESEVDGYTNECGIFGLHSRFGTSPGGPAKSLCSICQAPDFGCSHIPEVVYDDHRCHRVIVRWDVEEISIVRRPRDPRSYKLFVSESRTDVEKRTGVKPRPGEPIQCEHCLSCDGRYGPRDDDLDPKSWEDPARGLSPP